jgi:hypothetical protein
MSKQYLLLFLIVILFSSCGKSYKIKGSSSVPTLDGKTLYLKVTKDDHWVTVDSVEIIHGEFKMKGSMDSVEMVSLFMDDESVAPVVLENGNMEISINPGNITVKGTPLNDKLYQFIAKKNSIDDRSQENQRLESQRILDGMDPDLAQQQMNESNLKLNNELMAYVKGFIKENYTNVLGPSIFLMVCTSSFPYPLLNPELQELVDQAPDYFRNNPSIKEYVSKAKDNVQNIQEQQMMEQSQAGRPQSSSPLPPQK